MDIHALVDTGVEISGAGVRRQTSSPTYTARFTTFQNRTPKPVETSFSAIKNSYYSLGDAFEGYLRRYTLNYTVLLWI